MFGPFFLAQQTAPPLSLAVTLGMCTIVASLIGFGAGYFYGKNNLRWQFNKLAKDASRLLPTVLSQIDAAEKACLRLQALPRLNLSSKQTEQLEVKQTGLIDSLGQLLARLRPAADQAEAVLKQETVPLEWNVSPIDSASGFPDPVTVDENLKQMLQYSQQHSQTAGVLLLKMNKAGTFKSRFGPLAAEDLLKQLGDLVSAKLRADDFLARFDDDQFCVLLPDTDFQTGKKLAHQIRHAIRHGHFRLNSSGSEVLLSSSLGYALCKRSDTSEQVLNRARNALNRSEKQGRNQLFVHNGKNAPQCVAPV